MAWSSGQRRRLPLQGSAVRIPAVPSLSLFRRRDACILLAPGRGRIRRDATTSGPRWRDGEEERGWAKGNRKWNGYEKGFRFVSKKTIKWLTPIKGLTWFEKLKWIYIMCELMMQYTKDSTGMYSLIIIIKKRFVYYCVFIFWHSTIAVIKIKEKDKKMLLNPF